MSTNLQPPKLFFRFLSWFCHSEFFEELQGDLEESYIENITLHGRAYARKMYRREVLELFRPSVIKPIRFLPTFKISPDMLQNYFRIAWRNLLRQKFYGLINIAGLAIGLACVLLIALYVHKELSYDTFHKKGDRIARLMHIYSAVQGPWGPAMKEEMPEVLDATRFFGWGKRKLVTDEGKEFLETTYFAESNFFEIFTFPFIMGDSSTALASPNGIVLTESTANKYFGTTDVIGRTIATTQQAGHDSLLLQVTGVIEDVPDNSHFTFNQLASFKLTETGSMKGLLNDWYNDWAYTYLLLRDKTDIEKINAELSEFITRQKSEACVSCAAQPILKARLHSKHLQRDIASQGDINQVRIFSAVALLILIIACVNFMNLATARASRRAKEVGVRKAIGALRQQLIGQFLVESFLLTSIAVLISLGLAKITLPYFEQLIGLQISPDPAAQPLIVFGIIILTLFVSLLSGAYPAVFLSKFKPAINLKGKQDGGLKSGLFRQGLVILQFTGSIILIIGVLVVYSQLKYMKNRPLGFDMEQVLFINYGSNLLDKLDVIKPTLLQHPHIKEVSSTSQIMGNNAFMWLFRFDGEHEHPVGDNLPQFAVGHDFIETLDIEVTEGRAFSEASTNDSSAFILNESMVKEAVNRYGEKWNDPIGRTLEYVWMNNGEWETLKRGPVIGVIKDFHTRSLQHEIQPLILHYEPSWVWRLVVKVDQQNIPETLAFLEKQWSSWDRERDFNYQFLDAHFNANYKTESYFSKILLIFCLLAIIIACLGLFGLASFAAEQRTKEIGIRKIMGASIPGIAKLFFASFLRPIFFAILFGVPIAWWLLNQWLNNFAFRTSIGLWECFLASFLTVAIAVSTISYQTFQAARRNPVNALRQE